MYSILFLLIFIAVFLIFFLGKPQFISLSVISFLDSFEKIDYDKNDGRLKRDYLFWNETKCQIKIHFNIFYKFNKNPFNWKPNITVNLENVTLPSGFGIYLKKNNKDFCLHAPNHEMILSDSNEFLVMIEQNDNHIDLSQPQLVKFSINVVVDRTNIREIKQYEFLLGENLGDSWIAIDTGTTATTIAFTDKNGEITIAKNRKGNIITPSVLAFDKHDANIFFYGEEAESRIKDTRNYAGFRSIKKLLGYIDTDSEINKTGKEIAAKLINCIFNDVKKSNLAIQDVKRAVVAIPNNYTATKIKDMLFCIENLKQFKEIRLIYEAEAIVFYYMSNKSKLEEKFECKNKDSNETVLVFDMGGATMNVTIAQICKKNKDIYEVNILSKIGYGIGGDSIDYCILKSIFEFVNEIPDLHKINIFDRTVALKLSEEEYKKNRENLIDLSFRIKKKIFENQNKTELISANDLEIYLKETLQKNISIDIESDFYRIFKSKSKFCILKKEHFNRLIYNSAVDATNEVLEFSGKLKIDKIILSGRSSSFPYIENNIRNSFSYSPDVIDLNVIGVAKTAVVLGACWYGIKNNCIKLNNLKTSANFGFIKTKSPDKEDIRFETLINAGQNFTDREYGQVKSIQKTLDYRDPFSFDGCKVNFYQVMGSDAEKIIACNQKHKYNKVSTIKILQESEKIGMRVNENDDINCSVRLVNGNIEKEKGVVADQEITNANEEHYTWIVN